MSDVSGIPNLGIPGLSGFNNQQSFINPSPGLAAAQDSYSRNQQYFGNQAATLQAAQVPQSQLYGGGSFGAQPAYYAGVGATYGRAVAPSSPAAVAAQSGGTPTSRSSVFDTGTSPVPYLDSPPPGSFSPSPNYVGGRGTPSVFDTGAPPVPYQNSPPMGSYSPSPNYPGGTGETFASRFGASGFTPQMQNQPAINAVNQFAGRGTGVMPDQPSLPPSQPDPFDLAHGAFPSNDSSFANRFAAGNYFQPGQPSEQTTSPYTNARGETFQPSALPPGFSTPFSADNPSGALTREMRTGTPTPVMNAGDDEPPPVSNFGAMPDTSLLQRLLGRGGSPMSGASPAPPPLSGSDTLTAGDKALTNPFISGTSPVPFSSMRDRMASTITGPPLVNGGPQTVPGTGGPMPGYTPSDTFDPSSYASPSNSYSTFQRGASNPWTQQVPGNDPNIMNAVYGTAGKVGADPAALANVINTESQWNPRTNTGSYFGATQIGPQSFNEAGGRLGGMNFSQYKQAPLEQQIPAYGDWLQHYAQPGNAAGLASSGIRDLPVPMQSAIMQGTQFGPNATGWPAALEQGNMSVPTTRSPQATFLGVPPTINSMDTYFGRR